MSVHLRIAIAGSRTISDYCHLINGINAAIAAGVITPAHTFEIVSGGARGVDSLAAEYAKQQGVKLTELKPIYLHEHDRGAPFRRNIDIANSSDVLVAIWDGQSRGTQHMISQMEKQNKPVYVHQV